MTFAAFYGCAVAMAPKDAYVAVEVSAVRFLSKDGDLTWRIYASMDAWKVSVDQQRTGEEALEEFGRQLASAGVESPLAEVGEPGEILGKRGRRGKAGVA